MTVLYLREKSYVQSLSFLLLENSAIFFQNKRGMKYSTSGVWCMHLLWQISNFLLCVVIQAVASPYSNWCYVGYLMCTTHDQWQSMITKDGKSKLSHKNRHFYICSFFQGKSNNFKLRDLLSLSDSVLVFAYVSVCVWVCVRLTQQKTVSLWNH